MSPSSAAKPDSAQENGSRSSNGLPSYAAEFADFHEAFARELREVIDRLPLGAGMRVLDIGCGDGFYTRLLAERLAALGAGGEVVGLDNNPSFLDAARRHCAQATIAAAPVRFVEADLKALAEKPEEYDLVWCAQSLYSFPEPVAALKKIAAALKPGGIVAVLENDTLHQLLLPWPTELELVVRAAEFAALAAASKRPGKFYVGRRLPAVLAEAGLEPIMFQTQSIDRTAPLTGTHERSNDGPLIKFLNAYLKRLHERIRPHLDAEFADDVAQAITPDGKSFLLRDPNFACTWINVVAWGRKH